MSFFCHSSSDFDLIMQVYKFSKSNSESLLYLLDVHGRL